MRGAAAPYERSFALGQGDPDVLGRYALYCANMGQFERAEAAVGRAVALDPLNPRTFWNTGAIRYAARRFQEAIPPMQRALALNPGMANVNAYIGYCLLMLGRLDDASQALLNEPSRLTRLPGLAIVAHRRGQTAPARAAFDALVASLGDNGLYQQAQVLAQWGDVDGAVSTLIGARAQYLRATSDHHKAVADVERLIGAPLAEIPQ